jgi:predicted DNA-binding transcriptional regulator AlpA
MKKADQLSTKQVAEFLGVSDQTVINWMRDGVFPNAIKLNPEKRNSPIRIPRADVVAFDKRRRSAMAKSTA